MALSWALTSLEVFNHCWQQNEVKLTLTKLIYQRLKTQFATLVGDADIVCSCLTSGHSLIAGWTYTLLVYLSSRHFVVTGWTYTLKLPCLLVWF